ncbi:MAG: PEGA domain-containing protein [Proteobacteria bacterium]|nr:PEGA domain-containing protein [Pseudomonadota bacterium]
MGNEQIFRLPRQRSRRLSAGPKAHSIALAIIAPVIALGSLPTRAAYAQAPSRSNSIAEFGQVIPLQRPGRLALRRIAQVVAPETVAIVDLRPDSALGRADKTGRVASPAATRRAFVADLSAARGLRIIAEAELSAALAGITPQSAPGHEQAARHAVTRARAAFEQSDCSRTVPAADRAIDALAASQAAGADVAGELRQVYGYVLLCAHQRLDVDRAVRVVTRVERVGGTGPPPGVSELIWTRYPALDATTNAHLVELTIATQPGGATVWLDHQNLGPAPVTVLASEGEHLVAAALSEGTGSTAKRLVVQRGDGYDGDRQTVTLAIAISARPDRWADVAATVAAWRSGSNPADSEESGHLAGKPAGQSIGRLMARIGVRIALLLSGVDQVEIWALGPGEKRARRIGTETMGRARVIASKIRSRVRRWELTGPDPGVELLREDLSGTFRTTNRAATSGPRWWVYAVIIGAAATGVTLIMANYLADDRQRIELDVP